MPSINLLEMALGYVPTNKVLSDAISMEANYSCQDTAVSL